ncbi:hypothetical protein L211DRAFT_833620 [Terfezia boudieri ATCC MYA-4762]|uniref:Uncharacterized protein n=1 Tax=Terfezia boudieri ATCC MYA-4762 TaxID=1051890 RepID=A0A3N4M0F7_9PEZI|nr:hypothetical protein L211DRAFT_833620 [Terfezia boudieri ATCC MYA-4762]
MHFEATYEKRSSRSRSRSPLRSSLKRSASFSSGAPSPAPLGGYMAPAPPPPAPAPWVHGATRITYPALAYPSAPAPPYSNTAVATYNPTSAYKIPGAYPDPSPARGTSSSYILNTKTTETNYEYKPTFHPAPPSPRPLENPEVKAAIAHEQNLRMLSEQSHQETIRRQILEIEIAKTAVQRDKVRQEEEASRRMQRLYMLSQQQQQQQMILRAAEEAHYKYHPTHQHGRSRSTHSRSRSRVRSRSRSRSRDIEIEYDEQRRSTHTCGRCHHKGHYSKECHNHHHATHHRSSSMLLLEGGPRSSAPALLGPGCSRGRRSRRGSTVCSSDDEHAVDSDSDSGWWSDGYEGSRDVRRVVPSDEGVLVMYAAGGGPATRKSSIRHVVG